MKKIIFPAIILLLSCCAIYGQISTDEEPVSFKTNVPALERNDKVSNFN